MGKRLALLYIFLLTVTLTLSGCVGGKKTEDVPIAVEIEVAVPYPVMG